jgi:predicted aldo/keto reductase-like oxidoreductase
VAGGTRFTPSEHRQDRSGFFHDVRGSEYERLFSSGGLDALENAKKRGKIREIGISLKATTKDTA